MADPRIEWRSLRTPAILATLALLLLLGTVWAGSAWLEERERDYRRARSELARAANQYRSASDDKAVYEEYAARFRELERTGMIGEERRLSWVEALQSVNQELKLPVLRYEISPQRTASLDGAGFDTGRFRLQRSDMKLDFGALHEGDVLALLRTLADDGAGLMETDSCSMRRSRGNGTIAFDAGSANLNVNCRVHWYTLQIAQEEEGT